LRGTFLFELGNIGAGHEGLAAGAADHHDANVLVVLEVVEETFRRLPHVQRHRVVTLGIVEGQVTDLALLARQHLVGLGRDVHLHALLQTTFAARRSAISRSAKPNSLSTSSVCSPRFGGRAAMLEPVRDSANGWPTSPRRLPSERADCCAM